ncbi:transcriptional regulator, XRE family with cupin sensor [Caminicella sporogenes DSM 14501]|uniref:Transcriptional regulator, XRE family with cupin sensor n=1 Tax=Caminicella sporogenes DSM 14501 TaxID=1121266 RepID=A0A1M6L3F2_9FIRM|nr:XRE family transcriptional regulator [Caminicella sporogenes]RKD27690.1 Cro/Cl family transcriptional regulator [Caminicella sporogenes]WIF94732.1 XRE family transcriptional regulator [Caminicella sporogenes]SHJ65717.1 transcriptional regulator, XRE family with cupin sensor [Caminicella sporogenes DSM 14501]
MNIGEKIKRLRTLNNLTQDELAKRCDLTKGFISQIERNLTSPSIATLMDILEALGTDIRNFFNEEVEEKIVFTKNDIYDLIDENLGYSISWLIPNAQKNAMEPILLTLLPNSKTKIDAPHEGEEFGYILKGRVILHVGKQSYKIKNGESFYFKSNKTHYLENSYNKPATVLWISTPPTF